MSWLQERLRAYLGITELVAAQTVMIEMLESLAASQARSEETMTEVASRFGPVPEGTEPPTVSEVTNNRNPWCP